MCVKFPDGVPNCLNYGVDKVCEKCKDGFYLDEQTCVVIEDTTKLSNCKNQEGNICLDC